MAKGLFAPGHLGELTQIVPFDMVDEALAETGATQRRLRKLPAPVVVYLLPAAALFEECGYLAVWHRLTAALDGLPVPKITGTALWDARTRLGVRPMRARAARWRRPHGEGEGRCAYEITAAVGCSAAVKGGIVTRVGGSVDR